ncbi:MAG: outer membrane beta-barrel protein [Burkholderiaceae bacterium]|nr:outer membrane beta-barrel protein [Burkholderiaceae bacterium]
MKTIQTLRLLSLAGIGSLSLLAASAVHAQSDSYFYGGAGVGKTRAMVDDEAVAARLRANGVAPTNISVDESDTTFKAFAGYQFNRYLAVEAGYFNLGNSGFTATTAPAGTYSNQLKIDGVNADVVGTWPLTDRWSALGRVGAQYANVRTESKSTGAVTLPNTSLSEKSLNYKYGLGIQYEVNQSLFVRAEAELNRIKQPNGQRGNVCMYTVSVVIPFGRTVAAAPRAVVAPVYVAPAPVYVAPAPAPVIVEVPVQTPPPVYVAPARPLKQDRN